MRTTTCSQPATRTLGLGIFWSLLALSLAPVASATGTNPPLPRPTCEGDSAQGWHGVAVSREDADTLGAWSNGSLWVSRDDGRRWTRVLHLSEGYVQEAVSLHDGRFAVLAGSPARFLIAGIGVEPRARALPSFEPYRLSGGGGTLVLGGEGGFATSRDEGRSWRVMERELGGTADGMSGAAFVEADGTVRVLDVEVNTCSSSDILEWLRVHVLHPEAPRAERREYLVERMHGAVDFHVGANGWVYAWERPELLAITRHRAVPMRGFAPRAAPVRCPLAQGSLGAWLTCPPPTEEERIELSRRLVTGSNGFITLGVLGRDLLRLDGERAVHLSSEAPPQVERVEVDARGRAVALTGGGDVMRFSRRTRWTTLLPGCDAPRAL